ncbi:helix-turn-helix domain-containing protein, partial [Streptomyces sp. SID7982]|nr:helix-turn-helix domain-containing protein [Streptomyces sp. SID7982]
MTGDVMPAECRRVLDELRSLRERSGRSLAGLAAATAYSKSSWGRYLSGAQPVPRAAVVALCQVAGEPPARVLALWELADAEWSGRG